MENRYDRKKDVEFCAVWDDLSNLTTLFEQGKANVSYYCDRCMPSVKTNLLKLPYSSLFKWGQKGSQNAK
ncbi:hypothetical protein AB1K18_04170 [Peribacillus simplex]|uniref:hypothetical protein n=1 Tax=Peribacillus simplex TaxID=1478 RepID=UPI003B8E481D